MEFNSLKIKAEEINSLNVKSAADAYNNNNPQANKAIFDRLPEFIAERVNRLIDEIEELASSVYLKEETEQLISQRVIAIGTGDMAQGVYDTDEDGVVDDAARLGGQLPEHYATAETVGKLTQSINTIVVVDALPENPDANTLYLIPKG